MSDRLDKARDTIKVMLAPILNQRPIDQVIEALEEFIAARLEQRLEEIAHFDDDY